MGASPLSQLQKVSQGSTTRPGGRPVVSRRLCPKFPLRCLHPWLVQDPHDQPIRLTPNPFSKPFGLADGLSISSQETFLCLYPSPHSSLPCLPLTEDIQQDLQALPFCQVDGHFVDATVAFL